jgi:hypothetical protein
MADSSGKTRKLLKDRTPVHREEVFKKIRAEGADLSWLNARRHRAAATRPCTTRPGAASHE